MGSLRDFEILTEICTDFYFLLSPEHTSRGNLAQMLPASVEKVYLHEELWADLSAVRGLILRVAKDKHELLPNLNQLHINLYLKGTKAESNTMIAGMEDVCGSAGFNLIIH